jgi:anaerobic magnesium-protoporphyrin IX monomethyl ester cyclase
VEFAFVLPKSVERRGELQYLPLGVGYLASVLRNAGHGVEVVDGRVSRLGNEGILSELVRLSPDVVCATGRTFDIADNLDLLSVIRQEMPESTTILGGSHISALPKETMEQCDFIDVGVVGEGEATMVELAAALDGGRSLGKVDGIVYRGKTGLVKTDDRGFIRDLDSIPFPARDLFNLKRYDGMALEVKRKPMASVITSRGCPNQCVFCCKSTFGSVFRKRSPENVIEELADLIEGTYRYREIHFVDDTFTLDMDRAGRIFDLIRQRGWDISIAFPNGIRADRVSEELFAKMRDAGVYCVFFGVESADDEVLARVDKGETVGQMRHAIRLAKDAGFYVGLFFVMGLPGSTAESERKSLDFALDLDVDQLSLSVVTPYPGSRLYDMLAEQGLARDDWTAYRHDFMGGRLLYESQMGQQEVTREWNNIIRRFYLRPEYPLKLLTKHGMFGARKMYVMARSLLARKAGIT